MSEPLIYTINGNLPIASLGYHTEWSFGPDFIKLREWYTDASGAVVRESAHVYSKQGVAGEAVAAQL